MNSDRSIFRTVRPTRNRLIAEIDIPKTAGKRITARGRKAVVRIVWIRNVLPFSPCEDVNFVVQSSNPSIAHFLRSRSMSRGQSCSRVCLSPMRICPERSPKREPHPTLPRNL
jgi:hypothetical protein